MNRYIFIHRMTGPAILVLLGLVALLSQAHIVHFSIFVPLLLILIGVIKLAERAALTGYDYPAPGSGYGPGATPYGQGPYGSGPYGSGPASTSTSIVPTPPHFGNGNDTEGGQR